MKKILSIFSISAILTSGGILSGGGIACGSTQKPFNLNYIKLGDDIVGLKNKAGSSPNNASLTINGAATYAKIESDIINQYKKAFSGATIKTNDFITNSTTPTTTKPWALKLTNGNVNVTNTNPFDLQVLYNKGLASKTNSLKVTITSNDPNVTINEPHSIKTVSVPLYFNKYVFTTKDANGGDAIKLPTTGNTISGINLIKNEIIDLNDFFNFNDLSVSNLTNEWNNLSGARQTEIYNYIVSSVNNNFDTHMAETKGVNKVLRFSATNPVGQNKIAASKLKIFEADSNGEISVFNNPASDSFDAGQDLYFAIPVFNWTYLTNSNYISNSDTYVYVYLGTATNKFDLNSIVLPNNVIVELTKKARTDDEAASMTIDAHQTYANVENAIINSYNEHFKGQLLSDSDFTFDSITPTTEYPWAIKITNGNVNVTNTNPFDLQVWYNKPLASQTNSLSVTITTIDPNVVVNNSKKTNTTKTLNTNAYFNKYIFTTKDANNDDAIDIPATGKTADGINLVQNDILNFSDYFNLTNREITNLTQQWNALSEDTALNIYNFILHHVNLKFDIYMTHPGQVHKVSDFDAYSVGQNTIDSIKLKIFDVNDAGVISLHSDTSGYFGSNRKVYIAIPVYNWSYLTNANYFSNEDTYVYAYLGTTPTQ